MTITTTAFAELAKNAAVDQGVADLCLVAVDHPIASNNIDTVRKKAEQTFPDIMKAATKWQPPR